VILTNKNMFDQNIYYVDINILNVWGAIVVMIVW